MAEMNECNKSFLSTKVEHLKGIGPKKAAALHKKNIFTLEDLLYLEPRSYEDRTTPAAISSLADGQMAFVIGTVMSKAGGNLGYRASKGRFRSPLTIDISDGSYRLRAVFFNNNYISQNIAVGSKIGLYGHVKCEGRAVSMIHPQIVEVGSKNDVRGILPVYGSFGLSQNQLRQMIKEAVTALSQIEDPLPDAILKKSGMLPLSTALKELHFPSSMDDMYQGRRRLKFQEFLRFQLSLRLLTASKKNNGKSAEIICSEDDENALLKLLPFKLTADQMATWRDVKEDLGSSKAMNRLVQGDVGSGKTVVAMLALLAAAKSGWQGAMMVPTELLAKQHFQELSRILGELGINVSMLCSSMPTKEKHYVKQQLAAGETQIVVGTHALLQEDVTFSKLGLVVTDEQHRFGVNQRKGLHLNHQNDEAMVNVLLMSATPIPRTLSVIAFGDMDVSIIKQLPAGRTPVKTYVVTDKKRKQAYSYLLKEVKEGTQAYVVAPLIEPSQQIDTLSATEIFQRLEPVCKKNEISIGLVHGDMDQKTKNKAMEDFANGVLQILVSTVVIEVGINVPNASLMLIDGAHRFGLSQLHQLRGRVGRGEKASSCIMINGGNSRLCKERLNVMVKSNDGFYIAEEDLKLRGPGEIFGVRQSGQDSIDVEELIKNQDLLELASDIANDVLDDDPLLKKEENSSLKSMVQSLLGENLWLEM